MTKNEDNNLSINPTGLLEDGMGWVTNSGNTITSQNIEEMCWFLISYSSIIYLTEELITAKS